MQEELRKIIVEVCDLPPDFDATAHLFFTLGVPSLKAMILMMALEERYGIQIPDEQFVEAVTLEKMTAMMATLLPPA
jgi:acyl carrier protein